jgi:hypothetical protein
VIDPSIALSVRPPQVESPLEAYGQAMSLRQMANQQQLQQQQMQMGQLQQAALQQENQQRQLQIQQTQALNQAYKDALVVNPDGSADIDMGRMSKALAAAGAGSQIQPALENFTKYKQSVASLAETQGKVREQQQDAAGMLALSSRWANDDPRMLLAGLQHAVNSKAIDAQTVAPLMQSLAQALDQDPSGTAAAALANRINTSLIGQSQAASKLVNEAKTAQGAQDRGTAALENAGRDRTLFDTRNAASRLAAAKTQPAYAAVYNTLSPDIQKNFDSPDRFDPATTPLNALRAGMTPAEIATDNRTVQNEQASQNLRRQQIGIEQQNANTNASRLNLEKSKVQLDQGAIVRTAQALASGDLTRLKDIASLRGDQRLQIYDLAKQINPNFNTAEVDRKIKNEDYYANGKGAQNLQSFGTFLEHGGAASDAVNAIRLSNTPIINKPLNWWKQNLSGDPNYTNLVGSLEPVRKEFEGFLLGGRALYGDDRKAAETILSDNSSPAQIQQALKTMGHTAEARFNEENYRYKKVSGHDLVDPFSAEAVQGAQKIGVNLAKTPPAPAAPTAVPANSAANGISGNAVPAVRVPKGAVAVATPDGQTHWFPNQALADNFKRAARLQ